MLVYNSVTHDSRIFREAAALVEQGHSVEVIGRLGKGLEQVEERDGFTILRVTRDPMRMRLRRRRRRLRTARFALLRTLGSLRRGKLPARRREDAGGPPRTARPDGVVSKEGRQGPKQPQRRRPGPLHRLAMVFGYWRRGASLAKEWPADVYHAHDLNTLPLGVLAARRAGAPLIYDSHELFTERGNIRPFEKRFWRAVERLLIRRPTQVITVCDSFAEQLAGRYGIERPKTVLNLPDLAAGVPAANGELRRRASIANGEPIVLYQGKVSAERGLEHLVEAAAGLERGVVVIMGSGRLHPQLQEMVDSAGLGERVRLIGPVPPEELLATTAGASIGVAPIEGKSPSYYYAAPNKLFEYLGAGIPVVATRLPEMERVVNEREVGLLCEPGDPDGLAEAINRLLGDDELYERLRSNAVAAAKVYNWQNEKSKLLDVYAGLS
jgi:glycosyltransferase involved in cell wall biosynthesis